MPRRPPAPALPPGLVPYVMATPAVQAALHLDVAVAPEHRIDPMRTASSPFMDSVQRLDALLYGAQGLTAPRWALYDCAGLPGVVIGYGEPARALSAEARARLGAPEAQEGLVPVSMMIAIPMLGDRRWLVYGLGAARGSIDFPRLQGLTLALGLRALAAREITATVQWGTSELAAFAGLAPVRVLAAWLPAHDLPATAVLRFRPRAPGERGALDASAPITLFDSADTGALRALQRDIEQGLATTIAASFSDDGAACRVPLQRAAAPAPSASRQDAPRASPSRQDAPRASAATTSAAQRGGGGITLHPRNERLLRDLVPYVVATPDNLARLDLAPFGLVVPEEGRVDPLHTRSETFLTLLSRLDAITFGPEGMPMARWLFVDGSELPGGIVGLARAAGDLDAEARALLRVPETYAGLVPLAQYIAVPTLDPAVWVGHNLASAAEQLPGRGLEGLGRLAKALALAVYRASAQIGATQWASRALHVHARMGPLALLSAWTPSHADAATLTYRARTDATTLRHLAGDPAGSVAHPPPDMWIDSEDTAAMQALQVRIEAGERFWIAGAPETTAPHHQRVPVATSNDGSSKP